MTERKPTHRLKWIQGRRFQATTPSGQGFTLDGDMAAGVSPMEALLAALCGCMGIDVVNILQKMRTDLQGLRVEATTVRNDQPPQYFKRIDLSFFVRGDIPREKIDRAIQLSFDTYCSVFHSLRKDLETSVTVVQE